MEMGFDEKLARVATLIIFFQDTLTKYGWEEELALNHLL